MIRPLQMIPGRKVYQTVATCVAIDGKEQNLYVTHSDFIRSVPLTRKDCERILRSAGLDVRVDKVETFVLQR